MVNILMFLIGMVVRILFTAKQLISNERLVEKNFSFICLTNLNVLVLSFFSPSFDKDSSSCGLRLLLLMITDLFLLTTVADYHGL